LILGFAHLTLSTRRLERSIELFRKAGFVLKETHRTIPSSAAKWPLMAYKASCHTLVLLKGRVPIEIVSHDTGSVDSAGMLAFDLGDGTVTLRSSDVERDRAFISKSLPCTTASDGVRFQGLLPAWNAQIQLVEDKTAPRVQPLDIEGYSCLAFYSTSISDDVQRLVGLGAENATEEFAVELNNRKIGVAMMRSPGGAIIELIKVSRR
jgi:hypothetical protein